jgi:hypothetical protein
LTAPSSLESFKASASESKPGNTQSYHILQQ